MKFLLVFILLIPNVYSQINENLREEGNKNNSCEFRQNYFSEKLQSSTSLNNLLDKKIDSNNKILLFGENHDFIYGNNLVATELLQKIIAAKKYSKVCLFREQSHSRNFFYQEIEKIYSTRKDLTPEELSEELSKSLPSKYDVRYFENSQGVSIGLTQEYMQKNFMTENITSRAYDLVNIIKLLENNIHIRGVDTTDDIGEMINYKEKFKDIDRDHFMANNIITLQKEIQCDLSIFWGGAWHLQRMKEFLGELGSTLPIVKIRTSNLNDTLTDSAEEDKETGIYSRGFRESFLRSGQDVSCPLDLPAHKDPIVLNTKGDQVSPRTSSNFHLRFYDIDVRFHHFDYHILVPINENNAYHPRHQIQAKNIDTLWSTYRRKLWWQPWLNKNKDLEFKVERLK